MEQITMAPMTTVVATIALSCLELKWLLMQMDSLENCGMWMAVKMQVIHT